MARFSLQLATVALAFLLITQTKATGQNLLIPDSDNDRVLLLSGQDGAVINSNFLDIAAISNGISSAPVEAMEVDDEIWVSDLTADRIWRFGRDGSFLGDIGGGTGQLENAKGMERVGDSVFIAIGTANSSFEGIAQIDIATRTVVDTFNSGADAADVSYWDVEFFNGELLVTNFDRGNDSIERYDLDGNFLGLFAESDGESSFDGLRQLNERTSNSNLLGGGSQDPVGVYEFDSNGDVVGIVAGAGQGAWAAFELGNGEIIYTNSAASGNIRSDSQIYLSGGAYRYISVTSVPEPTSCLLITASLAVVALVRRRT